MWFEAALVVLVGWLAARAWAYVRSRRWDPSVQQPGDRWKIIDMRSTATGHVSLMQSENDGRWGVQAVPTDENRKSTVVWYVSEEQARQAFAKN